MKKIDTRPGDAIYKPVLLGDATRPAARQQVFELFRLTDSMKMVTEYRSDQI